MDKYGMLGNIRAHSIMVEKVATIIAQGVKRAGYNISMEKVTAGALMHDIGKTICLNSNSDHAEVGRKICIQNNFGEIAEIVGEHIRLKKFESDNSLSEKEIIYYADKRVNHDKIVSIEERLEYLLERYAKGRGDLKRLIMLNFDQCRKVEEKIFSRLDFEAEDLNEMIE